MNVQQCRCASMCCVYINMYVHTCLYTYLNMYTYIYICTHTCTYIHMYDHIYMYACTCVFSCLRVYCLMARFSFFLFAYTYMTMCQNLEPTHDADWLHESLQYPCCHTPVSNARGQTTRRLATRALVTLTYPVQLGMVWVRASAVSQASNLTPGCAPIRQKRINRQIPKLAAAFPQCTIRNTYRSV